jgi:hypothetical protein
VCQSGRLIYQLLSKDTYHAESTEISHCNITYFVRRTGVV